MESLMHVYVADKMVITLVNYYEPILSRFTFIF